MQNNSVLISDHPAKNVFDAIIDVGNAIFMKCYFSFIFIENCMDLNRVAFQAMYSFKVGLATKFHEKFEMVSLCCNCLAVESEMAQFEEHVKQKTWSFTFWKQQLPM